MENTYTSPRAAADTADTSPARRPTRPPARRPPARRPTRPPAAHFRWKSNPKGRAGPDGPRAAPARIAPRRRSGRAGPAPNGSGPGYTAMAEIAATKAGPVRPGQSIEGSRPRAAPARVAPRRRGGQDEGRGGDDGDVEGRACRAPSRSGPECTATAATTLKTKAGPDQTGPGRLRPGMRRDGGGCGDEGRAGPAWPRAAPARVVPRRRRRRPGRRRWRRRRPGLPGPEPLRPGVHRDGGDDVEDKGRAGPDGPRAAPARDAPRRRRLRRRRPGRAGLAPSSSGPGCPATAATKAGQ